MPAEETLVDAVARATLDCPAVVRLHQGGTRFVATYLAGRRVVGVRVDEDRVLVSVVLGSGATVRTLEKQVRDALGPLVEGREIDVYIADVDTGREAGSDMAEDKA